MPKSLPIDAIPQLAGADACHGSVAPANQLSGATLFDIIVTVVILTDGK